MFSPHFNKLIEEMAQKPSESDAIYNKGFTAPIWDASEPSSKGESSEYTKGCMEIFDVIWELAGTCFKVLPSENQDDSNVIWACDQLASIYKEKTTRWQRKMVDSMRKRGMLKGLAISQMKTQIPLMA